MPSQYIAPFDFKKIFLDFFLGNQSLFMFAFMIIISFSCAKLQIPDKIFLVILTLSSLIFGFYLGEGIYVFILFIVGYISFKSIARIVT